MVYHDCLQCGAAGKGSHKRVFCRACWHTVLRDSHNHHTCRRDALQALYDAYWSMWERSGAATLWRNKVLTEYGSTDTERRAA